jgi:hypothetical protein
LTEPGSASQRKNLEFVNKTSEIDWKLTCFCSAAQGKIWNCQQKQLKSIVAPLLVLPCHETFWNLPTKATQINCILFSPAANNFRDLRSKSK